MADIENILTSIVQVALGAESFVTTGILSKEVTTGAESIDLRDLLRFGFGALGIDIEFSGKGIHEKGVVVDIDEELNQGLGLDPDTLRFGQTVVRVSMGGTDTSVDTTFADIENTNNKTAEKIVTAHVLDALALFKNGR